MPQYTHQQMMTHYGRLAPEQKAAIDAAGGPNMTWFTSAVNAGVPSAVRAAGGTAGQSEAGWEGPGGATLDPRGTGAAASSEWMGQRAPTPSEMRRWALEGGQDEDYMRYSDRQVAKWIQEGWDPAAGGWKAGYGAHGLHRPGGGAPAGGGGGGGGGGWGGGGGSGAPGPSGTYAGAPAYWYGDFEPPSYEQAMEDPGYQFARQEGLRAIQGSAAAGGTLRTGGTLTDLMEFGTGLAGQQYQNVWDRAADEYGINRETSRDIFAPQYGSWQTAYGGDLSRWTSRYGGNLSKYLQQEQNIYGLLNQPAPQYPGGY